MTRPTVERVSVVDELFEGLGRPVVTHGCLAGPALVDSLADEERRVVERAVDIRRHEFAGGRACAHASLGVLGIDFAPITARPDRSPVWPSQVVGSITHSEGYCLASVSRATEASIGLDVEVVGRVTSEISTITLSVEERRWTAATDRPDAATTAVFAAKEALYKAQHPVTGNWLDFADVEVSQTADAATLRIDLVTDIPAVRHLGWPISARWSLIEPVAGRQMAVVAVSV